MPIHWEDFIADRMKGQEGSPTLSLATRVREMRSQGLEIASFTAGEPDFETPEEVIQKAIEGIRLGKTKYTPAGGIPELKEKIAQKFSSENSLNYQLDQITASSGAKQSIFNIFMALINPGDEVLIPSPYWVSYPDMVKLVGGVPVLIKTSYQNDFKLNAELLKKHITKKTKLLILNSPNNPTGAVYTREELKSLAEVLEGTSVFVVSDEIYEKIIYTKTPFVSFASLSRDAYERTFTVNGFSKSYAMTGWRLGYVGSPSSEINRRLQVVQAQTTSSPTSFVQWAGITALGLPAGYFSNILVEYRKRRDFLLQALNQIPGLGVRPPDGSFYLFVCIAALPTEKYNKNRALRSISLGEYLLEKARVSVVPGVHFGDDDFIRMSFATSFDEITSGVARMQEALS